MSLNISWLEYFPRVSVLLQRHKAAARVLGAFPEQERAFISASQDNIDSLQAFRGIPGMFESPFETASTGDFRGLKAGEYSRKADAAERFSEPPFAPPQKRPVLEPDTAEKTDFEHAVHTAVEDDVYLQQDRSLRKVIEENPQLAEAFISGNSQIIEEELAEAAKKALGWSPEVTEEFLRNHPDEALAIAANLGNITELLDEPAAVQALTRGVRSRVEEEVFTYLAKKAADLMGNSQILDEAFFRSHPRAALYLLANPEERRRIAGNLEAELEFRNHVAGYEARIDAVKQAQELADSNPVLKDQFWQDNPGLAQIMVAEKALGESETIQESSLGLQKQFHEEARPSEIVAYDQARRALSKLGEESPLTLEFLTDHIHFSRLINEKPEFASNLIEDPNFADLLPAEDRKTRSVLRAYVSGFPGRYESSWLWWA